MSILDELLEETSIDRQGIYFENYFIEVTATVESKQKPDLIFMKMRKSNTDDEWLEIDRGFSLEQATAFINSMFRQDD